METKEVEKETKTVSKTEKAIQSILKNKGFDLFKVIDEKKTFITVAFGHKKHNHSELIKHNFSKKTNETIKVNGDVSFKEFVKSITPVETIDFKPEEVK